MAFNGSAEIQRLDDMDSRMFFQLVSQMRSEQKKFFATRSNSAYKESMRLERIIDAEIERVQKITNTPAEQKTLF